MDEYTISVKVEKKVRAASMREAEEGLLEAVRRAAGEGAIITEIHVRRIPPGGK